ncbi:glycine cleavage system protein GcvH [soil metagenome]
MTAPRDLKFTKSHEWVRIDGDVATFGLTDHAQSELGDITYLELPEIGGSVTQAEPFGVVESVKAASDIYAPLDGEVIEINAAAVDGPDVVNKSPYEEAWLIKIKIADPAQASNLMDPDAYDTFEAEATH